MDRTAQYRYIIRRVLADHAERVPSHGQVETLPLFDETHDNYAVIDLGWDRMGRVHAMVLHVRLHNGKVWIEQDGTEDGVANEFVDAGIPREDIVLAFYRPERRKLTDFAVT